MTQQKFLSVRQAADLLEVSTQTIRRLIWDRQLAGVRVGERGWRIPADELTRLRERALSGADTRKATVEATQRFHNQDNPDTAKTAE